MKPTIIVIGVLALGAAAYGSHRFLGSCSVGVTGTDATVTVSGWRATAACHDLQAQDSRWVYLREEPLVGDVLCEVRRDHRHYVVRDKGALLLVGRMACAALNDSSSWRQRPH